MGRKGKEHKLQVALYKRNAYRKRQYEQATLEVAVTYYPNDKKKKKPVKVVVSIDYKGEYKSKEWKLRRKQIKTRDGFKCVHCGNKDNLEVHHTVYQEGFHIWEYEDQYLKTLCEGCHELEHKDKPLSAFFNKGPKLTKFVLKIK